MATYETSLARSLFTSADPRALPLISLISQLSPPRVRHQGPDQCRLIFDGRLDWAYEPVAGDHAWFYLPRPARACQIAGCLVLMQD